MGCWMAREWSNIIYGVWTYSKTSYGVDATIPSTQYACILSFRSVSVFSIWVLYYILLCYIIHSTTCCWFFVHNKATTLSETKQDIVLQKIGEVQMLLIYTMRLQNEPAKHLEWHLLIPQISWESCGIERVIGVISMILALIWRWSTFWERSFQQINLNHIVRPCCARYGYYFASR